MTQHGGTSSSQVYVVVRNAQQLVATMAQENQLHTQKVQMLNVAHATQVQMLTGEKDALQSKADVLLLQKGGLLEQLFSMHKADAQMVRSSDSQPLGLRAQ